MTALDPAVLTERLSRLVAETRGTSCRVANMAIMADGHAGLTFGFEVRESSGSARESFVLKLAPVGVPRRGSTDIHRQVHLLEALHAAGLPVPRVIWSSPDEDLVGAPFIVMERLPGRTFVIWEPDASFGTATDLISGLWRQAAIVLAQIHAVDWQSRLKTWEAPVSLEDELQRWSGILRHAQDPAWLETGSALLQALGQRVPGTSPIGLVHGDFQPGNVLFEHGRLSGVIDWDLACISAQGIDIGWLMMMTDQEAWAKNWKPCAPLSRAELLKAYLDAGGPALTDVEWFQAFAHYRMGAIACLNVKLHRNGRRLDPLWERFAPSIATLFSRGAELLRHTPEPSPMRSLA